MLWEMILTKIKNDKESAKKVLFDSKGFTVFFAGELLRVNKFFRL